MKQLSAALFASERVTRPAAKRTARLLGKDFARLVTVTTAWQAARGVGMRVLSLFGWSAQIRNP